MDTTNLKSGRPRVRRGRRGEGSIVAHGRGYLGRIFVEDRSGKTKRVNVFGKTKDEVRQQLRALQTGAQRISQQTGSSQTLAEFLATWLQAVRPPTLRLSTYRLYECLIRLHIAPNLREIRLRDLTEEQIQELLDEMGKAGSSARRRQQARGVLHKALKYAAKHKLVASNVCAGVEKPRYVPPQPRALTEDEAARFMRLADADHEQLARTSRERKCSFLCANLFKIALRTGMRLGELLAMQWPDVDLRNRSLSVRYTLTIDEDGNPRRTEPKTPSSRRRLELSDDDVAIFRDQRQRLLAEGLRAEPWVFPAEDGGPLGKEQVERGPLKRIIKAAGIPKIRFHDLRHTCATLMLGAGVHPKVAQEILGHASIETTLDLYSHVTPTMQRQAVDMLSGVLREATQRLRTHISAVEA